MLVSDELQVTLRTSSRRETISVRPSRCIETSKCGKHRRVDGDDKETD